MGLRYTDKVSIEMKFPIEVPEAVSYTHLDVYKRQLYRYPDRTILIG